GPGQLAPGSAELRGGPQGRADVGRGGTEGVAVRAGDGLRPGGRDGARGRAGPGPGGPGLRLSRHRQAPGPVAGGGGRGGGCGGEAELTMPDYDNPHKEGLDKLFALAFRFFREKAAARVDWSRDYETLETELRPLLPDAQTATKYVDKLVKLWLLSDDEA